MKKISFPDIFITSLIVVLAFNGKYNEILAGLIFAGFIVFVVNSGKYEKVNDFFDRVF